LLLAAMVGLGGCGRKLPPLPPITDVPETTQDLTVYQDGANAVLTWSYPALTRAGRLLTDLQRVEVFRLDLAPGQELPPAPELQRQLMLARGRMIARLEGSGLAAATVGSKLRLEDPLQFPEEGTTARTSWYAVRSRRGDGTSSALSNLVSWQAKPVPGVVERVAATARREGVMVTWSEVAGAAYLLERQEASGGGWQPLGGGEPLKTTEWLDREARQGAAWRYRVRAVIAGARGPFGPIAEVEYPDVYPPPPPAALVCLPEALRVRLSWESSPEAGVRYRIHRRREGEEWHLAGEDTPHRFFDDHGPPSGELEYQVAAVDAAGNTSPPLTCVVRTGL